MKRARAWAAARGGFGGERGGGGAAGKGRGLEERKGKRQRGVACVGNLRGEGTASFLFTSAK